MNEKIEKPITVARQELVDSLANCINNSNLPLFIVEPILKDVYLEVKSLTQKQYEAEKAEYDKRMQSFKESETPENDNT